MNASLRSTPLLVLITLSAFASNSILCRLALVPDLVDPGTFTVLRLASGALMLVFLLRLRKDRTWKQPHWGAAVALGGYAALFSYSYVTIPVGVGAFVLFAAVQITMIGWDISRGRRVTGYEWSGLVLAVSGLAILTLPGSAAADVSGVAFMAAAGICWGVYSILGKGSRNPLGNTGSNFVFAVLLVWPLLVFSPVGEAKPGGVFLAVSSGALASGLGYVLWYALLPRISATQAAILQMLVPVLAAGGGVLFLNEFLDIRMVLAGTAILSGIFIAVVLPAYRNLETASVATDSLQGRGKTRS
ncbi:MAG: membrane protein [Bacteroidia bacterium]|nr:MAG: membrane protein [Bacteroidia bacterium]